MAFADSPQFGVWLNMHPRLGLDPRLDDTRELTLVDAVTGACLAMRRADFERVGGWDERYLIGDFEDSDLCLKLLAQGLRAAYLPTVQLTHLERQTVAQVSGKAFRQLVTLYNAAIHKTRWDEVIRKLVATSAAKVGT
jgi:GT2 family glycosyltransferase